MRRLVLCLCAVILGGCTSYMPIAGGAFKAEEFVGCTANATAEYMVYLFVNSEWQRREHPLCHPLLAKAAQNKVQDMLQHRYFGHRMNDGASANENVRRTGYVLPDWYWQDGNNTESIGLNYLTPDAMFEAWRRGDTHAPHVEGSHPFFAAQGCVGAGYVAGPGNVGIYYALVSAPCPGSW